MSDRLSTYYRRVMRLMVRKAIQKTVIDPLLKEVFKSQSAGSLVDFSLNPDRWAGGSGNIGCAPIIPPLRSSDKIIPDQRFIIDAPARLQ